LVHITRIYHDAGQQNIKLDSKVVSYFQFLPIKLLHFPHPSMLAAHITLLGMNIVDIWPRIQIVNFLI